MVPTHWSALPSWTLLLFLASCLRRRLIVRELIAELRATDRKIAPLDADIASMLDEHGTTLTDIVGIGRTGAATILAITVTDPVPGPPRRTRHSRGPRRSPRPQATRSATG